MPTWPATLPVPLRSGYAINPYAQTVRTDMEAGAARSRRRTSARLDTIPCGVVLNDTEMAAFRLFVDGTISGGASWFDISLPVGDGGLSAVEARMVGEFKAQLAEGSRDVWNVSMTLEVR
jgi:hypothetical protein